MKTEYSLRTDSKASFEFYLFKGYYTVARRYKFYVGVARTIFISKYRFSEDFRSRSEVFWRFSETCQGVTRTSPNIYRKFPKITKDWRKLSRKIRRCLDDTQTNLSTISETLDISKIIDIFTSERIYGKYAIWFPVNSTRMYFPVKHSCLYNKMFKFLWI